MQTFFMRDIYIMYQVDMINDRFTEFRTIDMYLSSIQIACQLPSWCCFSTSIKKTFPTTIPSLFSFLLTIPPEWSPHPPSIHQVALGLQKATAWSQVLPCTYAALRAEVVYQVAVSQLKCYLSWWSRWKYWIWIRVSLAASRSKWQTVFKHLICQNDWIGSQVIRSQCSGACMKLTRFHTHVD